MKLENEANVLVNATPIIDLDEIDLRQFAA